MKTNQNVLNDQIKLENDRIQVCLCVHLLLLCPDCGHSAPQCHTAVLAADPVSPVLTERGTFLSLRCLDGLHKKIRWKKKLLLRVCFNLQAPNDPFKSCENVRVLPFHDLSCMINKIIKYSLGVRICQNITKIFILLVFQLICYLLCS